MALSEILNAYLSWIQPMALRHEKFTDIVHLWPLILFHTPSTQDWIRVSVHMTSNYRV